MQPALRRDYLYEHAVFAYVQSQVLVLHKIGCCNSAANHNRRLSDTLSLHIVSKVPHNVQVQVTCLSMQTISRTSMSLRTSRMSLRWKGSRGMASNSRSHRPWMKPQRTQQSAEGAGKGLQPPRTTCLLPPPHIAAQSTRQLTAWTASWS